MSKHANLPFHLYVNVSNEFLGKNVPSGTTAGIWHGVYSRSGQIIMCHVLLESGANWSGLPIHALSTKNDFQCGPSELMPWAAMGEDLDIHYAKYLEGLECSIIKPREDYGRHTGIVIDWKDGFSRYPQEHKPLNLIELRGGQFALLPNNFVVFKDKHFVEETAKSNLKNYKRGEEVYWGN